MSRGFWPADLVSTIVFLFIKIFIKSILGKCQVESNTAFFHSVIILLKVFIKIEKYVLHIVACCSPYLLSFAYSDNYLNSAEEVMPNIAGMENMYVLEGYITHLAD